VAGNARYVRIPINDGSIVVYASARHREALAHINETDIFNGVKLLQLFEEVYRQGKKDGAAEAFGSIDKGIATAVAASKKRSRTKTPDGRKSPGADVEPPPVVEVQ
jgi:hypothetical protein